MSRVHGEGPALFLVQGDATAEEVAALSVVLGALGAADAGTTARPEPVSEWAAHHRKVRVAYPAGPGGWRSSGTPR